MDTPARRAAWTHRGLMTRDGSDLTAAGERMAERLAEERLDRDYEDDYRMPHGWAPDPFPGGGLI